MRTVQMTLDSELVAQIDRTAKRLGLTRSAFARRAFAAAIERLRAEELERRHAEGYRRKPVRRGEFDGWTTEQIWPD
jgi:metal-responsive CopG/Arc/MetJ family transcriptional regulator